MGIFAFLQFWGDNVMLIAEMIEKLKALHAELGNVEVLITDGFRANCYRGTYEIISWQDEDCMAVDIGIGGCDE